MQGQNNSHACSFFPPHPKHFKSVDFLGLLQVNMKEVGGCQFLDKYFIRSWTHGALGSAHICRFLFVINLQKRHTDAYFVTSWQENNSLQLAPHSVFKGAEPLASVTLKRLLFQIDFMKGGDFFFLSKELPGLIVICWMGMQLILHLNQIHIKSM